MITIAPRWPSAICLGAVLLSAACLGQPYLDNETLYRNQAPDTETRRSEHFRLCFGHFNRDTGSPLTERLVQGNLQMFEQMWNRWIVEMGLHDINESATRPDGKKYRANFNFLMSWNDGGGGGAYSSMDGNGFFYAMANSGYCRFDPPSGATPHEFGHVWEGSAAGFNGTDSSGAWWECTANWLQLQFLNTYPQAGGYLENSMYYPAHGRDYYDSFLIWEAAREDPRYGAAWINAVWTDANADQQAHEFIIDRMIRVDSSGSPDKAGALKDLWGEMARKCITQDFERRRWLAQANRPDDGSDWHFYQRARTPLVRMAGASDWYRPARSHVPMQFGFNMIPLVAAPGSTVRCDFQPDCDPVRQSDWRACLVAVSANGDARYSSLWNKGTQSMSLSADETKLYLVVIATPKPMKIPEPVWAAYLSDAGLQFPYRVSFTGTAPKNVIYPVQSHAGMHQHANGGGWVANTATVDATAYVGPDAQVLNTAQVRGYARVEDYAVVRNSAQVRDHAVVSGHALVEGNAQVYGNAKARDWGRVFGYAEIFGNAKVIEHANCGDGNAATHTQVRGNAVIKGTTYVYDTSTFDGCLVMEGDSANGNGTTASSRGVHFGWGWGADTARFNALPDNAFIYAQHTFEKDNPVFAMDQFGINHGFLVNRCLSAVEPTRGGRVLALDGLSQYAELHNSVNDFRETTIAIWVKWTGLGDGQRIWSMGDGAGKVMYLTPRDAATGTLRLVISDGTLTRSLEGIDALPTDTWTHVAVTFGAPLFDTAARTWSATGTLYVDGVAVVSAPGMPVPDALNAPLMENANYLGRGNAGNYFHGYLDDFRVYMRTLGSGEVASVHAAAAPGTVTVPVDTTAPTPNAATWLVAPRAISDSAVTMSATPGADASGWVEYSFSCTAGAGHDSGWVSFNKYTDCDIPPGVPCTYTVRMRDRNGNMTAASAPASTTPQTTEIGAARFAYGPVGIADGQITMTAEKLPSSSGKVEYKFDRTSPTPASSGWQSSSTWTQTGLAAGGSFSYTVTARDGRGNTTPASAPASALARDDAAPALPIPVAHWEMQPYATIDNKVSMTAMAASDPSGVRYRFECVSGGGPDSAWQTSPTFVTPVLADGTYVYRYQVRDASPRTNSSAYSTSYAATITPTTGYHAYTLSQVATHPDDYLVSFPATVMRVNSNSYSVKDLTSGASILVKPSTSNEVTYAGNALNNFTFNGHLYTLGGARVVTHATLVPAGNAPGFAITGTITNAAGGPVAGATLFFSDTPNPSTNPVVTATSDTSGNYTRTVPPGTWHVAAGASAYNTSADRIVVVAAGNVTGIDFGLVTSANIQGQVSRQSDRTPIAGASVYFSRSPGASAGPLFTTTTDAAGTYRQPAQNGVWYVAAGGAGSFVSADKLVTVNGIDVEGIDFALKSSARDIPSPSDLWFSVVGDSLPASGSIGSWATYLPAGQSLTTLGSPSAETVEGVKWAKNIYADGDGFTQGHYPGAVAVNGVTIVAAVKPAYVSVGGEARGEVVDIFYDRLALAVSHADGRLMVARNQWNDWGPALANGKKVVLSLVVQPNGSYLAYTNGVQAMAGPANGNWTSIDPDHTPTWGSNPDFTHYVNVGRNQPDGWSTFSGSIGDVFVYKTALSDADRRRLEADLLNKFLAPTYTINVAAGAGGYANPGGTVWVHPGGQQRVTITPLPGYAVANVLVDGVPQGAVNTYTFNNVTANHALSATFDLTPTAPPELTVQLKGAGNLEISWPEAATGTLLESSLLGPGASWKAVGIAPVISTGRKTVTVTPGTNAAFFGLGP